MSETIQDLYTSFSEQMEPIQEDSRYFRYLFEMAQASGTTIEQQREELVKVVDEEWISMIEDSLDAINTIIENPRRFITTEEEVVPVSLAKKISADSVRHLSQNTQFLAPSDDGDVHPTRILNVSTVETYDLYENRFIYHLIQRLLTFVDKRTDVIFWSTGNEIRNRFKMHSKIDDAYEEIEYNVEMTVKNRQSFAENDADNMDVFMRIDRVRRLVMALRGASFCQIMNGCSAVRSPIQRTNLIMKDPNYRKCYQLWQFMERYDKVGYNIDVQQQALAEAREQIEELQGQVKSWKVQAHALTDERDDLADELDEAKTRELALTQRAQMAEADVEELRASLEDVEAGKKAAEDAAAEARSTAAAQLKQMRAEADAEVATAHADADAKIAAAEQTAAEQVAQVKSDATAALAAKTEADAAELQAAKDAAAAELAEVREASAKELAELHAKLDAAQLQIEEVQLTAERDARAAAEAADAAAAVAEQKLADTVAAAEEKVSAAQQAADAAIDAARAAADSAVEQAAVDASERVAAAAAERDAATRAAEEARADADARIATAELEAGKRIEQELAAAKAAHERELEAARAEMQQRLDSLAHELEQAERDRARAERRAEGNSLSRYLLARLRGEAGEPAAGAETAEGDATASAEDAAEAADAADAALSAKDDDK